MTRILSRLGACALAAILLASCGGDSPTGGDPGTTQSASKRSMLIDKQWQTYIYSQDNDNLFPGATVPVWITFKGDGSYRMTNGMLQEQTGAWELAENDTKLVTDKGSGFEVTYAADVISPNILALSASDVGGIPNVKWYLDRPVTVGSVDLSLFADKPWKVEIAIFDGNDVTTTAAGTTEFKSDGRYATQFEGGGTKSGTWEMGPEANQVTLDKGNSVKEKTWQIVELTANRLDMVDGDDRTLSVITPTQRTGGKNDLLTAATTWRVDSTKFNGAPTTLITSAPTSLVFKADGSFTEVRRNGQTYRSRWEIANNGTALTAGLRTYDIVELTATTLRIRRLYRGERNGILEVVATKQ